jgi:hypothetical protein
MIAPVIKSGAGMTPLAVSSPPYNAASVAKSRKSENSHRLIKLN